MKLYSAVRLVIFQNYYGQLPQDLVVFSGKKKPAYLGKLPFISQLTASINSRFYPKT